VTEPHNPDAAWFARTGHCGLCGQPGDFCLCTPRNLCGCRELHPVGTGRTTDPVELYADPLDLDQGELW
jgi:hypothetical protein